MRMINADLIWLLPLALIPVLIHILIMDAWGST